MVTFRDNFPNPLRSFHWKHLIQLWLNADKKIKDREKDKDGPYALRMEDIFLTWCPVPEKFLIVLEHFKEVNIPVLSKPPCIFDSGYIPEQLKIEKEIVKMKPFYIDYPDCTITRKFGYSVKTNTVIMSEIQVHA